MQKKNYVSPKASADRPPYQTLIHMPGRTINDWGPAVWNTLHVFAHTAPRKLDAAERRDFEALLRAIARRLPCPRCRAHFSDFLDRRLGNGIDVELGTRENLVALLNDAHNEVNRRTGKREYTLDEHYRVYALPTPRPARGTTLEVACMAGIVTCTLIAVLLLCQRRKIFRRCTGQPHSRRTPRSFVRV